MSYVSAAWRMFKGATSFHQDMSRRTCPRIGEEQIGFDENTSDSWTEDETLRFANILDHKADVASLGAPAIRAEGGFVGGQKYFANGHHTMYQPDGDLCIY